MDGEKEAALLSTVRLTDLALIALHFSTLSIIKQPRETDARKEEDFVLCHLFVSISVYQSGHACVCACMCACMCALVQVFSM